MKRITAMICAALLLAGLAFACNKEPAAVQLPDPTDDFSWMLETQTETETETEPAEPTDADPLAPETYTSIVYLPVATTTKTGSTTSTSKVPTLSGNASATTTTTTATKASTASTTTTTTTTRTGATQYYPGGLNIDSKDAALSAFNAAVKKALDSKAGFAKSHLITYKDWAFDQAFLDSVTIPGLGGLIDPSTYISGALNTALGKGVRSATAHKGDGHSLMKNSALAMADLKDVTYSGSAGGNWTVTLLVKDGETRQEKRLFGSGISGNSPIDKGPLHLATGDGNLYDHMAADKVFSLVKSSLSFINADPIDISESTSQVQFVAKIDGQGKLLELKATYNQTINLKDIRVLNGMQSYKDNKGSSTVTVTFDAFVY